MKNILKHYLQLPFLICVAVLCVAAILLAGVKSRKNITIIKKALPLKKSFEQADANGLAPYRLVQNIRISNSDIIESLGTEEYLQWIIEDTDVPADSPVRNCLLFVTYYTGNPDQVPHVPEACYTGGGNEVVDKFGLKLLVTTTDQSGEQQKRVIPATGLIFTKKTAEIWESSFKFPLIYFFNVNGTYAGNRTTTRLALANLTCEYSYFSKVEIKFFGRSGQIPNKEQAINATEKLLSVVLPFLEREHWPDWEQVTNPN